jgi:filamentous hemagglutinin family protein
MARTLLHTLKRTTALVPATLLATLVAHANPEGGVVVGGSATISAPDPQTLNIQQQTDKAIINWQSFDIGAGETTQFFLQSDTGVTLNRVVAGDNPSQILGTLKSNGTVMVINPDGILFGPNSVIDVGGLLATTSDIEDSEFMAGNYNFNMAGNPAASIVNQGIITAKDEGIAALVAPGVRNEGIIIAKYGKVTLGAANTFTLDFYGDNLINLVLTDELTGEVIDASTGMPLEDRVSNSGKISADGGSVVLKAATARKVVNSVINNTGVIEANSVGMKNGKIVLSAATAATKTEADAPVQKVKVSGTLKAAGAKPAEKGGLIAVTGEQIELLTASIVASGDFGGGTILVGGDYLGGSATDQVMAGYGIEREAFAVATASNLSVDSGSTINTDAGTEGKGGKVVVWSDNHTDFTGSVSSKGGQGGGDGGFVEVSGHNTLHYDGLVDLSSYYGKAGTLLLEPLNVVIGGTGSSGLSVSSIVNALVTSNVIVTTGATGAESGDITVAANITWASNNSLSLNAYRNIIANTGVTVKNTGAGDLNLRADSSGTGIGTVIANGTSMVDYSQSTGHVSLFYNPTGATKYQNPTDFSPHFIENGAVSDQGIAYMLVNNIFDLQDINQNVAGNYALGKDIDASATATWNSGAGFSPIGLTSPTTLTPFIGTLNGLGHTIDGLSINRPGTISAGLFADIAWSDALAPAKPASITDLKITNASVVGDTAGILAGFFEDFSANKDSIIQNVHVSGTVTGEFGVGGLIGTSRGGQILSSSAAVDVSGTGFVGGLVGVFSDGPGGLISDSYASGTVVGNSEIGGLVGFALHGSILSSYSRGEVIGTSNVGGLVGGSGFTTIVQDSYWDTQSSGQNTSASGTGLTPAQLKAGLPGGFDPAIWGVNPAINNGYPYLLWQVPGPEPVVKKFEPPFGGTKVNVNQSFLNPDINMQIANSTPALLEPGTPSLFDIALSLGDLTAAQAKLVSDFVRFAADSTRKYGIPVVLPEYENYGGLRWSAGGRDQVVPATMEIAKAMGVAPTDKLDEIFYYHDLAYANKTSAREEFQADIDLIIGCMNLARSSEPLNLKQRAALGIAVAYFAEKLTLSTIAGRTQI